MKWKICQCWCKFLADCDAIKFKWLTCVTRCSNLCLEGLTIFNLYSMLPSCGSGGKTLWFSIFAICCVLQSSQSLGSKRLKNESILGDALQTKRKAFNNNCVTGYIIMKFGESEFTFKSSCINQYKTFNQTILSKKIHELCIFTTNFLAPNDLLTRVLVWCTCLIYKSDIDDAQNSPSIIRCN